MAVVTGAMGTLLPKLGDLLMEEYDLQKNTRGEIMFLKAELESMEAALLKISEAPLDQPPDIQVKLWARDVRDLSYEIEDNVDKFLVRLECRTQKKPHSFMGFIHRTMDILTKAKIRHKIGTEVKDIKSRLKEVSERRDRYKVDNIVAKPIGTTIDSLRLSALYKKATELIGAEDKADDLVKRLMEGDGESKQLLKIVSIVGFGGLGKTTLANLVHHKLKSQFDCGAFVSVSLNPNMEKIFKEMLYELDEDKYKHIKGETWSETQLIKELRKFLQNKRYFIVIDDIWNTSVWKTIEDALPENICGSKVITTTRILDVAKQIGGVYELKPLSPTDSRKLFYQRIYGVENKFPPNQLNEVVSDNIVKRCGGVPLAIITTASVLATKNENDWSKVYHSMGSGLENRNDDVKNMRRILSVSYYDLPPHLKACLLLIGLYPEDYMIEAGDLIWQWIGEGYVQEEHGKSLYEVGEDYFNELINKSLIQPEYSKSGGKVRACRVHDMVLDLITFLSNEENFLTVVGGQQPVVAPTKIRRLSVQTENKDDVKQLATMNLSHVRSFNVFKQDIGLLPALSSFPVLRALDISYCLHVDNDHVKVICNMFHLRYLCLSKTSITQIPEEIGNLRFLLVLDISQTGIKVLPSTFVQLTQLVYLHIDKRTRLPDGFGNLKSLQALEGITITSPTMLNDLGNLVELRNLLIYFDEWNKIYQELLCRCVSNLVNLKAMDAVGCHGRLSLLPRTFVIGPRSFDIGDYMVDGVPSWFSSLSLPISNLKISLKTLGQEDLIVLGRIPGLRILCLKVKEPTEDRHERLVINSGCPFQCLECCIFESLTMEVVFAHGAMQNLKGLGLYFDAERTMDRFGDLDLGLENLPSLWWVGVELYCLDLGRPLEEEDFLSYSPLEAWVEEAAIQKMRVEAAIQKMLDMNPNKPTLRASLTGCLLQVLLEQIQLELKQLEQQQEQQQLELKQLEQLQELLVQQLDFCSWMLKE